MQREGIIRPKYGYFKHPKLDRPYIFQSGVTQEQFDECLQYKAKSDDVFVVTYLKCGTTWVMNILNLMRSGGKPLENGRYLFEEIPFLLESPTENVERPQEGLKIIKTHLCFDLTPWNPEAKYVFVARNPNDCFTSLFHHTRSFASYQYADGRFDDFFEFAMKGEVESGDYFKCVGEWYEKSKTEKNILLLLYEDMKQDPEREILKLAAFLGGHWEQRMRENNKKLLEKVVEGSSFEEMSKMKNIMPNWYTHTSNGVGFVRKGQIGDWKSLFNEHQSRRVDEKLREAGKTYPGFDRLWDKYSERMKF